MANYKGHLFTGSLFFVASFYAFSFYYPPTFLIGIEWFLFTLAGSLFPDVDIKSKGQHYFYWIVFVLTVFLVLIHRIRLALFIAILAMIPLLVRHRGICHRIWFVTGVPFLLVLGLSSYLPAHTNRLVYDACFFAIGAISHIWLDVGVRKMFRF